MAVLVLNLSARWGGSNYSKRSKIVSNYLKRTELSKFYKV